jgi:hypothetical protein
MFAFDVRGLLGVKSSGDAPGDIRMWARDPFFVSVQSRSPILTFSGLAFRIQTSSPQPLSSEAEERGLMSWRLTRGGARGLAYPGLLSETPIGVF